MHVQDSEVLTMIQSIPSLASTSNSNSKDQVYNHQANQTVANVNQTYLEILKLLKELAYSLKQSKPTTLRQYRFP